MFQNGIFGVSGKHMVLLSRLQSALGMSGDEGDGGSTVFLTVTQVAGDVGRFTPVEPAINYLKYYKVRLGLEIPKVINFLSGVASKSLSLFLCSRPYTSVISGQVTSLSATTRTGSSLWPNRTSSEV